MLIHRINRAIAMSTRIGRLPVQRLRLLMRNPIPTLLFHGDCPLGGLHRTACGKGEGLMVQLAPLFSRGGPW